MTTHGTGMSHVIHSFTPQLWSASLCWSFHLQRKPSAVQPVEMRACWKPSTHHALIQSGGCIDSGKSAGITDALVNSLSSLAGVPRYSRQTYFLTDRDCTALEVPPRDQQQRRN